MSKLHKILIGVFCAGVLITGVGVGVAFTEFSALSYGGKQALGNTEMKTEILDVEFEPGEERCYIGGWYQWEQDTLLTDNKIPENTVRFRVTYNDKRVSPQAYWNEEAHEIILRCRWIEEDEDMALLMEAKDLFLQNLKEGRIVFFDAMDMEEVTVTVNPANEKDVCLVW